MTADLGLSPAPAASFGALLKRLRRAREGPFTRNYGNRYETVFRELSQNELGRRAGLNPSAINHLEHDRYPAQPKRTTVENLADALELGPEERAATGRGPTSIRTPATSSSPRRQRSSPATTDDWSPLIRTKLAEVVPSLAARAGGGPCTWADWSD
jgi:transcriptional regulator with XRE-family HTH domain